MEDDKTNLTLPLSAADRLISSGDGEAALLYLYISRRGGAFSKKDAALALRRTEEQISSAAARLGALGLIRETALRPADEPPEYSAEEIAARTREDGRFSAVVDEAQHILGRMLSGSDMRLLFGIYSYLGLPAEVIMVLLHHCADEARRKYGEGRSPAMRTIEKEAYFWANREIVTLEAAEEHLGRLRLRESELGRTTAALGLAGRALAPTERKYIESWLDMGFSPDALELAYDRTVTNTGALKWKYMDSIVRRWDAAGLRTPEAIEAGDRRNTRAASPSALSPAAGGGDDLDRARRVLDKVRKG